MLVTCEKCQSKFKLDDDLVKESGTKVRCSNCQDIFAVYRPAPVEDARARPARCDFFRASCGFGARAAEGSVQRVRREHPQG